MCPGLLMRLDITVLWTVHSAAKRIKLFFNNLKK